MTKQEESIAKLRRRGFREMNRLHPSEEQTVGDVVMVWRSGLMRTHAQIDENGDVNGAPIEEYMRGIQASTREAKIASRIAASMDVWTPTDDGWSAFASDLEGNRVRQTPNGYPVNLNAWSAARDADNDITSWKKRFPDGKVIVVFND
jgi:hypothetical protein